MKVTDEQRRLLERAVWSAGRAVANTQAVAEYTGLVGKVPLKEGTDEPGLPLHDAAIGCLSTLRLLESRVRALYEMCDPVERDDAKSLAGDGERSDATNNI